MINMLLCAFSFFILKNETSMMECLFVVKSSLRLREHLWSDLTFTKTSRRQCTTALMLMVLFSFEAYKVSSFVVLSILFSNSPYPICFFRQEQTGCLGANPIWNRVHTTTHSLRKSTILCNYMASYRSIPSIQ
jgi:hypothetical protein